MARKRWRSNISAPAHLSWAQLLKRVFDIDIEHWGGMPSILVTVILVAQVPSASYELTAVTIISPGYACSGQWRSRALRWALTDDLARQDAPDWPARGDVGAPDRWDRRSVAEVFRGAVHLAEVDAVVADLCADVHLGDLHEVQGGEVHRPVVVVIVECTHYAAVAGVDALAAAPVADVHAAVLARDAVEVEGADQPRCIEAADDGPHHGAGPEGRAEDEAVVAEVDAAVVREADEVGVDGLFVPTRRRQATV